MFREADPGDQLSQRVDVDVRLDPSFVRNGQTGGTCPCDGVGDAEAGCERLVAGREEMREDVEAAFEHRVGLVPRFVEQLACRLPDQQVEERIIALLEPLREEDDVVLVIGLVGRRCLDRDEGGPALGVVDDADRQ
ncbi:hypothetical protein ACRJ4W_03050 [Streptomyces sp. GLT-R25]